MDYPKTSQKEFSKQNHYINRFLAGTQVVVDCREFHMLLYI